MGAAATSTGAIFNAADYLLHRHATGRRRDHPAVRGASEELTYSALSDLVRDVAAGLRALGVRRDDRVMLVAADDVPMLATILGAFTAGAVAVPVSTMFTGDELGKLLADSGARVLMCTEEFADSAATALAQAPEVEHVVQVGGPGPLHTITGPRVHSWDELVAAGNAGPAEGRSVEPTTEDSWALWLYTSGTTGTPKAAMHRHANIRHVCETYGKQVLGITPDDRTLSVAKMFFAYGIGNSVFFPFSVGATTLLEPRRPTPQVVAERLERDRPTLFFGVPTFYATLAASDLPAGLFDSVRLGASAGEVLPAILMKRFTDKFGVEVLDGIGSTEALHIFLSNAPGDIRPGTTGRAVPGYELEIRDDGGTPVAAGEPGALFVKGNSIALGYWRRTDASRQVFQGPWLSTGDSYVEDSDGYYHCLGRNTDMLKVGGIWVSPAEVEGRLLEHEQVREVAVVGIPDADELDKPVAVVALAQGSAGKVTAEELITWCRDGLAHFKSPRQVLFVDDLPKTATGKLQRYRVRELVVGAAPTPTSPAAPSS